MQLLPTFDSLPEIITFVIFGLAALIQLLYTFFIHGKLAFFKEKPILDDTELPPITVIIAARNEADNLFENLPYILQQHYPQFEVIVINNQSIDDSFHLLHAYQQQYPNLRIIEVAKSKHLKPGKKLPITLGVKGAKYEYLVMTDADCKPASNEWLKQIAMRFTAGNEIVIGYGPYMKRSGFLNRLVRFDTAWIGVSYLSMALARLPYMGVGRNMAYTKELFNRIHGFKTHYSVSSGDDDLFIQEAAKKRNYRINLENKSFCYSEASETWSEWVRQKTRHYSTADHYSKIKKWLLGIYPFSFLLLLSTLIVLLFTSDFRLLSLIIFSILFILKWWIQARCFSKLGEKGFVWYLPLWEIFYAFLQPLVYFTSEKRSRNRW